MNNKSTCDTFEQFYGTEHYFECEYNESYAYTDGMKYLFDHVSKENEELITKFILKHNNYKHPFTCVHIQMLNGIGKIQNFDEEGEVTDEISIKEPHLDNGIYKIFCYNHVMLAATEY